MSIDPKLLVSNFPAIMGSLGLLIGGKTVLVALVGRFFGVSIISAIRIGLLLAPGGEFAFVAFGEAVNQVSFINNCGFFFFSNLVDSTFYYSVPYKVHKLVGHVFNILCAFGVVSKYLLRFTKIFRYGKYLIHDV